MTVDLGIPRESIVLYGRSLGSGPTCYLAERLAKEKQSIAGVILYAPFTSVFRVVFPHFFGITMLGDVFPNIDRMPNIACPVMVIHGEADLVVPCSHGQALVEAARQRRGSNNTEKTKVVLFTRKGFGHNDVPALIGMEMLYAIRQFLQSL
jgi:abhydrolase domain-containing protein 17